MTVKVNGTTRTINQNASIEWLLADLKLTGQPCAVEVNAVLVPKRRHAEHLLQEGDAVEIVTLVGGG